MRLRNISQSLLCNIVILRYAELLWNADSTRQAPPAKKEAERLSFYLNVNPFAL